ncbi:MAG: polysaccharide biosynthesis protein [Lachnospiraceae bacterium]|nr:polysaccharide biosynthesis protein [Lachnospiraceae bacterium]
MNLKSSQSSYQKFLRYNIGDLLPGNLSWQNPLIAGTFILTITGLLSRFIGFFYRIFLSRMFGAEGMGIYQLTAPILALSFSVTVAGMQTAISKYVAGETATKDYRSSSGHLAVGFTISMAISFLCTWVIYYFSDFLATSFLMEPRTAPLLRVISFSIPMATVHSCINGYFYGIRKTTVPAVAQLVEQVVRVGSVFMIYYFAMARGMTPTITIAVLGLVIGESAAMIYSLVAIRHRFYSLSLTKDQLRPEKNQYLKSSQLLLSLAIPLSLNRIIINILQSVESIFIPNKLIAYGMDNTTALSVFGVLTGMALPLIFFPSAITNSISVLLLPIVSEADATQDNSKIKRAIQQSIKLGAVLGVIFTAFFLLFGRSLGMWFYQNSLAGSFIITLSFLCPFMYIASTLSSILHGIGKTGLNFIYSIISLSVRLLFIFFAIPVWGIQGYLWGLLVSQFIQTGLCMWAVRDYY